MKAKFRFSLQNFLNRAEKSIRDLTHAVSYYCFNYVFFIASTLIKYTSSDLRLREAIISCFEQLLDVIKMFSLKEFLPKEYIKVKSIEKKIFAVNVLHFLVIDS